LTVAPSALAVSFVKWSFRTNEGEDGGSKILQNVCIVPHDYTAL